MSSYKERRGLIGKNAARASAASVGRSVARALGVGARRVGGGRMPRARGFDTGPEKKYIDVTYASTIENSGAPMLLLCNGVAQGTDATNRIGRKVMLSSVQYKLLAANTATRLAAGANFNNETDAIRVALVFDKHANGVAPVLSTIWNVNNNSNDPMSIRNPDYVERYQVLLDDWIFLNVNGGTAQTLEKYLKLEHPVRFDGTTNAIADIETGSLYLIAFDQNAAASNQTTIVVKVRVFFTDL